MAQFKAMCTKILILLACTALSSAQNDDAAGGGAAAQQANASGISLGPFIGNAHDCKASDVKIIDEDTVEIVGQHYDGKGPATFYVVSNKENTMMPGTPKNNIRPVVVAVQDGKKCGDVTAAIMGATVKVKFPKDTKVQDYKYFALYCLQANNVFCYVKIKEGSKPAKGMSTLEECKPKYFEAGEGDGSLGGRLVIPMGLVLFSSLSVILFGRHP